MGNDPRWMGLNGIRYRTGELYEPTGASDQVMVESEQLLQLFMNDMLTDVNQFIFLLTIRNPPYLIVIYTRSDYR